MSKIAIAVATSLVAGLAVGALIIDGKSTVVPPGYTDNTDSDENAPIEKRLRLMEQVIADERQARLVLEDQLLLLIEDLEGLGNALDRIPSDRAEQITEVRADRMANLRAPRDMVSAMRMYQDRRVDQLVEGGFSIDDARRLLQQESEAQYKAIEAAHLMRRDGKAVDALGSGTNAPSILREEIGDLEFERYLAAQEQPTTVQISSVYVGSPADRAGLQAGDAIVSYNGERTFSMTDVHNLTLQGDVGENVIIEIDRGGVRMQLSIPRGPIGISGNGAMFRGMSRWGG